MFQELSCSSCDCDQCPHSDNRPQRHRGSRKGRKNKQSSIGPTQRSNGGPDSNPANVLSDSSQCNVTSVSSNATTIGGRISVTPSVAPSVLEHSSCLTETTDCPSEFSSVSTRRVLGSRLSSRTIGSVRSTGRSSVASRRVKDQPGDPSKRFVSADAGPDVIQLAATSASTGSEIDPHVLRLQLQLQQLRLQHYPQHHFSSGSGLINNSGQLRALVRECLASDGIKLSSPPYTSSAVRNFSPFSRSCELMIWRRCQN